MSQFSAEIPKGDGWGIEDIVTEMVEDIMSGKKSRLVPIIGVIDVKTVKIDPESQTRTAVIRVRRLESLTTPHRIRKAQRMMLEQVAERRGDGFVLPFEEKQIIDRAFSGQSVGEQLQDDEEERIDAGLSENDRLRRHVVNVHDHSPEVIVDAETTDADVARWHEKEHAKDPDDRTWPDHEEESTAWRRVDLAEMVAESEEPGPQPHVKESDRPDMVVFDDGRSATEEDGEDTDDAEDNG